MYRKVGAKSSPVLCLGRAKEGLCGLYAVLRRSQGSHQHGKSRESREDPSKGAIL